MNTNILQYVIAVAEEGNFTRAAQKLYVSQPTLSQGIMNLERQLGTPLFDRSANPVRPTYAGEEYLAWARQVVESEAQTMRKIADISRNRQRQLVVGASPYRSLRILPEVLRRFREETQGQCKVILVEQRSSEYFKLLEEGKLDLLIDKPSADEATYVTVTLAEEKILLAVPEAYALEPLADEAGRLAGGTLMLGKIRQEDARLLAHMEEEDMRIPYQVADMQSLRGKPVIFLSAAQHMGKVWRGVFDVAGFPPEVVLECQSIEMAFLMVRQGMGMTLVPENVIRFMPPSSHVRYYVLKDYPLSRTMAVLYQKKRYLSQDARVFISLLKEVVSN